MTLGSSNPGCDLISSSRTRFYLQPLTVVVLGRVTPRLTIDAGLRYDVSLPIHEEHNLLSNFDPSVGLVQVGSGLSQPYHADYKNFAPRLGIAWDPHGTGNTVFRVGGGIINI